MWNQADKNTMTLLPITQYGWKLTDERLTVDWDSEENIQAVNERVAGLLKGCHCKTGCNTARCGCKKRGKTCSEGCECTDCVNSIENASVNSTAQFDDVITEEMEEQEENVSPGDADLSDESTSDESDEEMEAEGDNSD
jgi:hypothetical protein